MFHVLRFTVSHKTVRYVYIKNKFDTYFFRMTMYDVDCLLVSFCVAKKPIKAIQHQIWFVEAYDDQICQISHRLDIWVL